MKVNGSQIADEISDIIKGSCRVIVQQTYMLCGVRSKNARELHKWLSSQLSKSLNKRKKIAKHLATIERHARLQKTAVGTTHGDFAFIICTKNKLYNSE